MTNAPNIKRTEHYMQEYGEVILTGLVLGTIARILMLRSDYRQYPGYPHGYITHLSLGFIAAALGTLAIPALAEKDFAAVTFLSLAAQQFRDIRNMERETMANLEVVELVPRGLDYVEGIARVFESRNYLVMFTALVTSAVTYWGSWYWAVMAGALIIALNTIFMQGKVIGDIAQVVPAKISFEGALLKVDEVVIMNVGLTDAREKILAEGLGAKIIPKNANALAVLHDMGQRQAILHTAASLLGTKREIGEQEWSPLARKEIDSGEIMLFLLPVYRNQKSLVEAINRTPVLESAKRKPLTTKAGKAAVD